MLLDVFFTHTCSNLKALLSPILGLWSLTLLFLISLSWDGVMLQVSDRRMKKKHGQRNKRLLSLNLQRVHSYAFFVFLSSISSYVFLSLLPTLVYCWVFNLFFRSRFNHWAVHKNMSYACRHFYILLLAYTVLYQEDKVADGSYLCNV